MAPLRAAGGGGGGGGGGGRAAAAAATSPTPAAREHSTLLHKLREGCLPASAAVALPAYIGAAHLASASLAAIDASAFGPCTLVCADARRTVTFESRGDRFRQTEHAASALMLTSSGLGDALVEQPRRALWHSLINELGSPRKAQAAFHAHRWPTAPHLSVCMERDDARTVSITTATRTQHGWLMTHTDTQGQPRTRHRLTCGDGVPA
jgi:hypothetical protein